MCVWEDEGVVHVGGGSVGEGVCVLRGEFNMIHIKWKTYPC